MAGIMVLGLAAYALAETANRDIKNRDIQEKNKNTSFWMPPDNGGVWANYNALFDLSPDKRFLNVVHSERKWDLYEVPYQELTLSNRQKVKHYNCY